MNSSISTILLWAVRVGIWVLLLTPVIITPNSFFPYITGKNFFFRIVTELVFGCWLALITLDAQFRPRRGILLWAFLGFIAVLGVSTILGADPYESFWSNYERMEGMITYLHLAALFLAASSVFRNGKDWRLTMHISVVVSIFVALYGFLELFGFVEIPGSTAAKSGSGIFSWLGNQIYLAAYLLFHFFILGFLYFTLPPLKQNVHSVLKVGGFTTRNIWLRIAYIVVGLGEFYIFLHTGTRGALIGFTAGFGVSLIVLFLCSLRNNKRLALYTGGVLFAGALILGILFLFRESAFVQRYPLLNRFADIRPTSSTAQSRFMIWGIAREAFMERPLLGWGPGNFIIPYAKYYNPNLYGNEPWFDRVHNMHFEWLVAGGVVGFAAYLSVLIASAYALWQLWRNRILDGTVVAVIAGFIVAYLGQNTFVFDTIITYLFFVLILALLHSLTSQANMAANQSARSVSPPKSAAVIAPVFIVVAILFASTAHLGQMQVAEGIITMLNSVSQGATALDVTRQLDEIKRKDTFGTAEAQERFVDFLFAAVRQREQIPSSDLLFLLSRGIEEMKDESKRNPENVKPLISLGKLLQLRYALTGSKVDRDEAIVTYETALKQAPHYPSITIGLAEVYLTAQDTARASELMNTIFQEVTRPNTLIYPVLSVSVLDKNYKQATEQVRRFASLGNSPSHPLSSEFEPEKLVEVIRRTEMVGGDLMEREQFLETMKPVFTSWTRRTVYLQALANVKAELGKIEEAKELAQMAGKTDPALLPEIQKFIDSLNALSR